MVVAAFAGERPTPGYGIEIVGARREGSSLAVIVNEIQPPRGTIAAQMIVTPFHIVTLPRYEGQIRFTMRPARRSGTRLSTTTRLGSRRLRMSIALFVRAAADAAAPSSTGLEPNFAAALAYLAGPFSGILILLVERSNDFVRFHAWQAILGLGGLGLLSAAHADVFVPHTAPAHRSHSR